MSEPERPAPGAKPVTKGGGGSWSLKIGTVLGIPIRVHFTFLLLLVWFGQMSLSQGKSFVSGVVLLLLIFGSVVLHELGHAVVALRFKVRTREIVLYPIGGVARMESIPSGAAELLIALAGPVVNLLLALALVAVMAARNMALPAGREALAGSDSLLLQLLMINFALFIFNLIPAFPMDGGRVLRATLTFFLSEEQATLIAARVGQGMAILFAAWGLLPPGDPILVFIAFFVFLGAGQEAAFQRSRAALRGLTARSAMITRFETLAPQDSMGKAAELLLATHQQDFPVLDAWGRLAGVLHRAALLEGLARFGREGAVLEAMAREAPVVHPDTSLEKVLALLQGNPLMPVMVVDEKGLQGLITVENFGELIEVSKRLASHSQ